MKTMWTFSVTKGWYRSEHSLAAVETPEDAKNEGFKQLDTYHQIGKALKSAIYFQRVKKNSVDYLACYTIGDADFWFYMGSTAAFIEVFCHHRPMSHQPMMR